MERSSSRLLVSKAADRNDLGGGNPEMASGTDRLAAIKASGRIVVLTGAGLSTESGVPDFRSPASPWRIHKPIDFAAFLADPAMRAEAWRRKFAMDDIYAGAKPGRGHHALVRLAERGQLLSVITQNIDGLHQAAGLAEDRLVELHGNGTFARCLSCGRRHDLDGVRRRFDADGQPPACGCGGIVKSASIAFGQKLDPEDLSRACAAALDCDLFVVLGSSLVVRPAARFPLLAKRNGARLAILNREPTPLDIEADLVVRADIGDVLTFL